MLLRIIAENVLSFKEATEFNLFPSSKTQSHDNHKIDCGHATALRFSAVYGANGAGKSNLIKCIELLQFLVGKGSVTTLGYNGPLQFAFDQDSFTSPSSIAAEILCGDEVFYYVIEFDKNKVYKEELYQSKATKDVSVFTRDSKSGETHIFINKNYSKESKVSIFEASIKMMLRDDMLMLSFIDNFYPEKIPACKRVGDWFKETLVILDPVTFPGAIPHMMDRSPEFNDAVNRILPEMKTGIERLDVLVEEISEYEGTLSDDIRNAIAKAKQNEGEPQTLVSAFNNEVANIVYEGGKVLIKRLRSLHKNSAGTLSPMPLQSESDGTHRMIEYMPMMFALNHSNKVFIIDEIERSVHPILIKQLVSLLSKDIEVQGQLIFTTHESCLLDQDILRPDEIWFAEKDPNQATKLYPLSEFNIHRTANIENGYLNGRYGGIPFLSKLKELHW